jgi:hypothetical protein
MKLISNLYVQKSNWFLYPLLGIKKSVRYKPSQTYIADLQKGITDQDNMLICVYKKELLDKAFQYFEDVYLFNNYHFKDFYETKTCLVYIFDLSHFSKDFQKFIKGKYSGYSEKSKAIINGYYAKHDQFGVHPHPKINAYLNPTQEVFEQVSEEYGIPLETVISIGEVIDKPDLDKEIFIVEPEDELIKEEKKEEHDQSESKNNEERDTAEVSNE